MAAGNGARRKERLEEIIAHPGGTYRDPMAVVTDPDWSRADKRRILEAMELDALRGQETTAENMPPADDADRRQDDATRLQRVKQAQAALEQ